MRTVLPSAAGGRSLPRLQRRPVERMGSGLSLHRRGVTGSASARSWGDPIPRMWARQMELACPSEVRQHSSASRALRLACNILDFICRQALHMDGHAVCTPNVAAVAGGERPALACRSLDSSHVARHIMPKGKGVGDGRATGATGPGR